MNVIDDEKLKWKELAKQEILKTVVFNVNKTESISPTGEKGNYIVLDAPDWGIVIPEQDDKFLMVKQWRHGEKALSIEFPGGVIEKGEDPEKGAARELLEETGCTADKIIHLATINPNPALMCNHTHIYLAQGLHHVAKQQLDTDEYVSYLEIPIKEVYAKMGNKEYPHAIMMAALAAYRQYKDEHQ